MRSLIDATKVLAGVRVTAQELRDLVQDAKLRLTAERQQVKENLASVTRERDALAAALIENAHVDTCDEPDCQRCTDHWSRVRSAENDAEHILAARDAEHRRIGAEWAWHKWPETFPTRDGRYLIWLLPHTNTPLEVHAQVATWINDLGWTYDFEMYSTLTHWREIIPPKEVDV